MRSKKGWIRLAAALAAMMLMMGLLAGCGGTSDGTNEKKVLQSIDDIEGGTIGYFEGSSYMKAVQERFPDCEMVSFMTVSDLIEGLKNGRIDLYVIDYPLAMDNLKQVSGLRILEGRITKDQYAYILNLENTGLRDQINEVLAQFREEGVLDQLTEKWMNKAGGDGTLDLPQDAQTPNGVMRIATNVESVPFAYLKNEQIVGFDIELICRIALEMGYEPQVENTGFVPSLNSIQTGRADVAVGMITYTAERAETMLFTDSVFEGGVVAVVREETQEETGVLENLAKNLERTLITEGRWKLIVGGLAVTMRMSFLSVLFGTVLGFCFSFALRSRNRLVSAIANGVSTVFDGLPLLVILMVLYYVVLAKTSMSAEVIGIIGFSLDFANGVAGTLNTGIRNLDKGQTEGGLAMGYSRMQIFAKITLPQVVNHMFAQYSGSVIALIKGTSIIGYITVQDLTKASDIIRGMTYEAFTPLIITAILYFVICRIFVVLLGMMAKKLDPKHRPRTVKGVKTA